MISRRDAWPLGAVGFILTVSAVWWTFALWSLPDAPEWLDRARAVCFNLTESGLPDAKGWLLLIGQPPAMLAALFVGWGTEVRDSLGRLVSAPAGRMVAMGTVVALVTGLSLAGRQVLEARIPDVTFGGDEAAPETYPRLDRPWPSAAALVEQSGEPFDLTRLEGRPALVTFAFGHCATICPVVVHQTRQVRLETGEDFAIVVYTVDPWRDTPTRLPALVRQFELDPARDFVVSGSIEAVTAALERWNLPIVRDERNGDITHPGIVYLVEPDGTIAYASTGGIEQMVSLARRLRTSHTDIARPEPAS